MVFVNRCLKCGQELPVPARRGGRARLYCSDRCRKAAFRSRRAGAGFRIVSAETAAERQIDEELAAVDLYGDLSSDPDEAVLQLVLEGRALVSRLAHSAGQARPQFAWRLEQASEEIAAVLRKYFTNSD